MVEPISHEQAVSEGMDMLNFVQTKGWLIIVDEANKMIATLQSKFETVDPSKVSDVMDLQHQIKGLKWLLGFPATVVRNGQAADKLLAEETQPES